MSNLPEKANNRGAKETYKCAQCNSLFEARIADRKRGWARFCSKSCKAIKQEKRTGQMTEYLMRGHKGKNSKRRRGNDGGNLSWDEYLDSLHPFDPEVLGQS